MGPSVVHETTDRAKSCTPNSQKIRSKNDIQIHLVKPGYQLIVKVLDNYSVDLIDSFDG